MLARVDGSPAAMAEQAGAFPYLAAVEAREHGSREGSDADHASGRPSAQVRWHAAPLDETMIGALVAGVACEP